MTLGQILGRKKVTPGTPPPTIQVYLGGERKEVSFGAGSADVEETVYDIRVPIPPQPAEFQEVTLNSPSHGRMNSGRNPLTILTSDPFLSTWPWTRQI